MSVQNVGLNSPVLNKVHNIQSKQVEDNKAQSEPVVEDTKNEVGSDVEPEKKSHKVRNWSIGLSAAAVLIGLGVAGRKGKLGSTIEKALGGGAEKDTGKLADDIAGSGKADDGIIMEEISAEEFEQIKNAPKISVGGNKKSEPIAEVPKAEQPKTETPKAEQPKAEQPKVEQPKSETPKVEQPKAEQPKTETPKVEQPKAEQPKTETPKAESKKTEVPKAPTISQAEKDAINAKIDRVLPIIGEDLKSVKAPTIDEIKKMGFDFSKFKLKAEPKAKIEVMLEDGRKQKFVYDSEGNLENVWLYPKDSYYYECNVGLKNGKLRSFATRESDCRYFYNEDFSLDFATRHLENHDSLFYNKLGLLERYTQKDINEAVVKDIEIVPETGEIERITYGADCCYPEKALKIEEFDGKSKTPIKEIYIKDGQKIVG